jgi:hypothetical protein
LSPDLCGAADAKSAARFLEGSKGMLVRTLVVRAFFGATVFLSSCAVAPPMPDPNPEHPASPQAAEAPTARRSTTLKQSAAPDATRGAPQTAPAALHSVHEHATSGPTSAPTPMPGMKHPSAAPTEPKAAENKPAQHGHHGGGGP